MADEDWRHKRAVELGLIDTGPWLGGKAARPAPEQPAPPPPRLAEHAAPRIAEPQPAPPPSPILPAPPVAVPRPAAAPPSLPPATPPSTPPLSPPVPTASARRASQPTPPAQRRPPAPARRLRPWHIAAAAAAIVLAFAIGWLLRAATTPSSLDRVLASDPVLPAPASPMPANDAPTNDAPTNAAPTIDQPPERTPPAPADSVPPPVAAERIPPALPKERSPLALPTDLLPPSLRDAPNPVPRPAPRTAPRTAATPDLQAKPAPRRWSPPRAVAARGRDFKPSFNCRRATATVTRMICDDAELAALDREMSSLFSVRRQTADLDAGIALDSDQSNFLNARGACTSAGCIARSYRNRIEELR